MSITTAALFVCLDDFAKTFEAWERERLVPRTRKRQRKGKLSRGEMLFIMVLFHLSPFKDFKPFWVHGVEQKYRDCFGDLPSYGRFVALMPRLFAPLALLMHSMSGDETGIYVADSTMLAVCANPSISRNRTFKGLAARGHSTMGWFFGFKLHVVMNNRGELMAVKITPGNTDDRAPLPQMVAGLEGKLLADKGYISKKLFDKLWHQSLHLITGIRKNMKNHLMPIMDKILLQRVLFYWIQNLTGNAFNRRQRQLYPVSD